VDRPGWKGRRGVVALVLVVVVATLAVSACGRKTGGTAAPTSSTVQSPSVTTAAATFSRERVVETRSVVQRLIATWNSAWSTKRSRREEARRRLPSLYADDVAYYDAAIDRMITKAEINGMSLDPEWWKSLRIKLDRFFVSPDGRFAAILGRIALRDESGVLSWQPAASVHAIADGRVHWEYDYYGGEQGVATQLEAMLAIPRGPVTSGYVPWQTAVDRATATMEQWVSAYNERDLRTFLSFYAKRSRSIAVVSPDWQVLTKDELASVTGIAFSTSTFASKLEPSPGSALDRPYFVSSDGRFAAVQGTYIDSENRRPMLAILELEAGSITRQYTFIAIDRDRLGD
jgi:hypothetical protein